MEIEDIRDCTRPAAEPAWSATLTLAQAGPPQFELWAAGPGLHHLSWPGHQALVAGQPRPEQAPGAADADPDPVFALLQAFEQGGVSALRRVEGGFALVHWDQESGELLLAVDRLARQAIYCGQLEGRWEFAGNASDIGQRHQLQVLPQRLARMAVGEPLPAGQTVYQEVEQLLPGHHLRLRSDGSRHDGVHGTWRLEKRERRPLVLVAGEFTERLKSVLRLLGEEAELMLLAEEPVEGALVAAALAQLPGPQASLLYLPALSAGSRDFWKSVSARFSIRFEEAGVDGLPGLGINARKEAFSERPEAERTLLEAHPGLRQLAAVATPLARRKGAGERPPLLLSARGFDLALPPRALPGLSLAAWREVRSDSPPAVAALGSALADAFGRRWAPPLEAALRGSGLRLAWPMLDETVAHFLANLPTAMRHGRPWSIDFRRRVLRDLLPAPLRLAAIPGGRLPATAPVPADASR